MRAESILGALAAAGMVATLYLALLVAPTEASMGDVQRIFYLHVPSAWATFACFFTVAGASAWYLWKRSPGADRLALASAEVGVLFCTLVMITGPIWARPIWGVWWTWDPRLTMTVILWAIYAGYLLLRAFGGEDEAVARWAAVLGIVGVLDIPIIRVSVRLLQGMHPAVITTKEGTSGLVDPTMRLTLYVGAVSMLLLAAWLVMLRMRTERLSSELGALRRQLDLREGSAA
ncbi:MAG: cytochrome c biogenesis protein CcsA [bacterium]|nr:cytochrome c biogenesis protein CcsA [bacterium]